MQGAFRSHPTQRLRVLRLPEVDTGTSFTQSFNFPMWIYLFIHICSFAYEFLHEHMRYSYLACVDMIKYNTKDIFFYLLNRLF